MHLEDNSIKLVSIRQAVTSTEGIYMYKQLYLYVIAVIQALIHVPPNDS